MIDVILINFDKLIYQTFPFFFPLFFFPDDKLFEWTEKLNETFEKEPGESG